MPPSPQMRVALDEARAALGTTSPNPAVGAVVVRDGEVIARGRTQPPLGGTHPDGTSSDGAHAEVMALRAAGDRARGAEVYCTLEPCAHHGRTPPCTDALIAAGVRSVTYALRDPFPQVDGRGHAQLEAAGIEVHAGDGEAESRELLAGYLKHQRTGLPLVVVKYAASLDGRIAAASGDSRWVSGPETLRWAHQQRPGLDAMVVGSNTVIVDNPELTARPADPAGPVDPSVHQPLRIVVDTRGRIPETARVLQGASSTLVVTAAGSDAAWRERIAATGAEVLVLPSRAAGDSEHVDLAALVAECGRRGMLTVLFEGGGVLLGSVFDQRLVDRVHAVIAPIIVGATNAPTPVAGQGADRMRDAVRLRDITVEGLGEDTLISGTPDWAALEQDADSRQGARGG
ncbi:MAG: bifunctional diaminohydroxyphosphoribosylaminopyrimidine deaminase/5-amino-6-(5-phosphoribosylamino)uracil reductase RibD [Chloroflexi bacterium]|nr:bifunctional diaminohydroxyphosphoribosylaminopyrimidine deaminase/5-amino-6-(5-phosphoribosylamino)uracil reductase RibD [Chloroflexota bacterium]